MNIFDVLDGMETSPETSIIVFKLHNRREYIVIFDNNIGGDTVFVHLTDLDHSNLIKYKFKYSKVNFDENIISKDCKLYIIDGSTMKVEIGMLMYRSNIYPAVSGLDFGEIKRCDVTQNFLQNKINNYMLPILIDYEDSSDDYNYTGEPQEEIDTSDNMVRTYSEITAERRKRALAMASTMSTIFERVIPIIGMTMINYRKMNKSNENTKNDEEISEDIVNDTIRQNGDNGEEKPEEKPEENHENVTNDNTTSAGVNRHNGFENLQTLMNIGLQLYNTSNDTNESKPNPVQTMTSLVGMLSGICNPNDINESELNPVQTMTSLVGMLGSILNDTNGSIDNSGLNL